MKEFKEVWILVAVIAIGILLFISTGTPKDIEEEYVAYECDVNWFDLHTDITIYTDDNVEYAKVSGNILRFLTDPLTMYDPEGNKIGIADDTYHVISQDSHSIFLNGEFSIEMVGLIEFFGESYDFYDSTGTKVATATFNYSDSEGELLDMSGNLLADYTSRAGGVDYTVRITENCDIPHNTVLMIFASYYSDKAADSN